MTTKIVSYHGDEIKKFIPEIARLRIEIFREYPFLYEGNLDYEKKYLKKFETATEAIIVLAFDNDQIIGASTGLPFSYEDATLKRTFVNAGRKPDDYFYFGESILRRQYRGLGIGNHFFDEREKHARHLKRFSHICFCTAKRPENDPMRPKEYRKLNSFWEKRGYKEHPELHAQISWKEIGEAQESPKEMIFWIKEL